MEKLWIFWFRMFSQYTKDESTWWVRFAVWAWLCLPFVVGVLADNYGWFSYKWLVVYGFFQFLIFGAIWAVVWAYNNWWVKHHKDFTEEKRFYSAFFISNGLKIELSLTGEE